MARATTFRDRADAGRRLAAALEPAPDALILALPRGGVPVAAEVARAHGLELDVLPVRKIGVPGHRELAGGALAPGGPPVWNRAVLASIGRTEADLERVLAEERAELTRRQRVYRGDAPPPRIAGREVWLIDDGLATGATMRAAVAAVRAQAPTRLGVAVPVAPADTGRELRRAVDAYVCLAEPEPFRAVGLWYERFDQVDDDTVVRVLEASRAG